MVLQGLVLMANEGTIKAYFRGNGANVMKNIPETVSSCLELTALPRFSSAAAIVMSSEKMRQIALLCLLFWHTK